MTCIVSYFFVNCFIVSIPLICIMRIFCFIQNRIVRHKLSYVSHYLLFKQIYSTSILFDTRSSHYKDLAFSETKPICTHWTWMKPNRQIKGTFRLWITNKVEKDFIMKYSIYVNTVKTTNTLISAFKNTPKSSDRWFCYFFCKRTNIRRNLRSLELRQTPSP